MNKPLLEKLKKWQAERARRDNVEAYRVLPYSTLEEIARHEPQTAEELLEIKGIKEKKLSRYGKEILAITTGETDEFVESFEEENKIFEVSEYLDFLNLKLLNFETRIKGEVSSVDNRGNYVFFSLKDKKDESLLNCFMWNNDYEVSGIELEEGMEILIWGYPNIYKPSGRISFQTKLIELVGEGALKKAYEALKGKLEAEGIFAPERKKPIPDFPNSIGLITSHQGAAVGDFISNLGSYGFQIKFYDSRVEGKQAVFDLIKGIKWFNKKIPDLDVIVLTRGGGSLESLQAFNSEQLVREIENSEVPVLAGIGHEKDISLAALAADKMVSTPTAAAVELRKSWDEAIHRVNEVERKLLQNLSQIFSRFEFMSQKLRLEYEKIGQAISFGRSRIENFSKYISAGFGRIIVNIREKLKIAENQISSHNPERQLRLGYSIARRQGKILRSTKEAKIGDIVGIELFDGSLESEIKNITNN